MRQEGEEREKSDQFHDRAERMALIFMLVIPPGENFDLSKRKVCEKKRKDHN